MRKNKHLFSFNLNLFLSLQFRIHEIRDKNTLEVPETFEDELKRWTMDSVSVVALDKPLGLISKDRDNADAKRLFHLLEEYFIYSLKVEIIPPIYKYYKTKTFRKYMQILDGITEITHKYVQEAIERIEKQNQNEPKLEVDNGKKSVLEKLINIDKKIGTVMAMDLLMGGIDTVRIRIQN